jgi:tetratricopeptide (TPR) repeat protein
MGPSLRFAVTIAVLVPAAVLAAGPQFGSAGTAECLSAAECADRLAVAPVYRQFQAEAGEIHQLKLRFVDAVRLFAEAQAGTFGDEGPALEAAVESMRAALAAWDARVQRLAAAVTRERDAEPHVTLAGVYLDRHRIDDAIRELTLADARQAGRGDVQAMLALAYGLAQRPADAQRALRTVVPLAPDDPQWSYLSAQRARELRRPEDAVKAIREFTRAVVRLAGGRAPARPGRFERIDLLREVAGVAPIFAQRRYAAGFSLLEAGEYSAAVNGFAGAVAGDPLLRDDSDASRAVREAAAALRSGDLRGMALIERLAAEHPNASEIHRLLGAAAWVAGDTNRSIEALRLAARNRPDDERARLTLAFVLDAAGRPSEVERELRGLADLFPESGKVHYLLAQLQEKQSRLSDAARSLEASVARRPIVGREALFQRLGSVLTRQADLDGAIEAFSRRVAAAPNSGDAHRHLGDVLFLRGHDDEALGEFAAAVWLDPADARAHTGTGQVYLRTQDYAAAVAALQRALALTGAPKEARYALAIALTREGRVDEGRREMERFQQMQAAENEAGQRQFQAEASRRAGMQLLREGQLPRAVSSLTEAAALSPDSAPVRRDLGLVLLRAGRVPEAIEQLAEAQRLEPSEDGYGYLAEAYAAAGDVEAGREQLLARERAARTRRLAKLRDVDLTP